MKMRLIDADELLAEYDRQHEGEPGKARKLIEDAPTIDRPTRSQFKRMAVQLGYEPVVHCKNCKHKDTWTESKIRDWFWCGVSGLQVVEDMDFCSYGERKENDDA
jgi:hypothetical protein